MHFSLHIKGAGFFFFFLSLFLIFYFCNTWKLLQESPNWSKCREKVAMGHTVQATIATMENCKHQVHGISLKKAGQTERERTRTPGIRCCLLDITMESMPMKSQQSCLDEIRMRTTAADRPISDWGGALPRPTTEEELQAVNGHGERERDSICSRDEPKWSALRTRAYKQL